MRTVVGCLVGFVVVATCGCVVKVNGQVRKFGLDGEEKVSAEEAAKLGGVPAKVEGEDKGKGGSTNPDDLAAELSGQAGGTGTAPAKPSGQTYTLKTDFSPNPHVVGSYTTKAEDNVYDQPHGVSKCSGHVGKEPAVVLNLQSTMKDTRISAPGAQLILAEWGDAGQRKYICKEAGYGSDGAPSVMLSPEWPSGAISIFVGGKKGETYKHEVRIEDEKRPIDILWKDKVKTTEIADVPKEPIIITDTTPSAAGAKGRCGGSFYRDMPDMAFKLKRPLGDMSIEVRSAKPIDVQWVGPLTENGRNIPGACFGDDDFMSWTRMDDGFYGLRVGTQASGDQVLYHIIFRSKDTPRNPTAAPSKFVDSATVEESVILWHYPQLLPNDLESSDAYRESIFLSAPKPLFVFPKFNMDKSVAEIVGGRARAARDDDDYGGAGRAAVPSNAKNAPALEYPKENEPLILINKSGLVMAADGSLFDVNPKDLQADPSGNLSIPAAPRNTALSFDAAVRTKGPEDAKAFAAWEKAGKDLDTCERRSSSSFEGTIENACAGFVKALEKKKDALEKELTKNRVARRAASLAKIKTRLETVFKK